MPKLIRKEHPDCMLHIINALKCKGDISQVNATTEQLVEVLLNNGWRTKTNALRSLQQCVRDGLLVKQRGVREYMRLPQLHDIAARTHDVYCFECHLPGQLISCRQCAHAFHRRCIRRNPERNNKKPLLNDVHKWQLPNFDSDSCDDDLTTEVRHKTTTATACASNSHEFVNDIAEDSQTETTHTDMETETKADVLFVAQVRPPTRKRAANEINYKKEACDEATNVDSNQLCTCCRLMQIAALRQPPDLGIEELCYLLNFTFKRNRSWVKSEISSFYTSKRFSAHEIDLITHLLFTGPALSLKRIEHKLTQNQYKYIMELLVDLLDLQHCMGVLFGSKSQELMFMSYLVRYISHDLSEISRCPDCFRNSNEKHTAYWFSKPCVQRHELVLAKAQRSPYWPAKILRVLRDGRYDVRFFGGKHERALVHVLNIRAIDSDVVLNTTSALKQALNEMRLYEALSLHFPSKFSFYADKTEMENIIYSLAGYSNNNNNTNSNMDNSLPSAVRKRGRPRKLILQRPLVVNNAMETMNSCENDLSESRAFNLNSPNASTPNNLSICQEKNSRKRYSYSSTRQVMQQWEKSKDTTAIIDVLRENEKLKQKVELLKQKLKKSEVEKRQIKRKQWCSLCLKQATISCCILAAYCSRKCQKTHWKKDHEQHCKVQLKRNI